MRAADIKVGSDYRMAWSSYGCERGRAVTTPSNGHLRIQMVDPDTGELAGSPVLRSTRNVLEPWEDYAPIWAEKEARRVAAESAADALDAALHQRGITARQGPFANSDAAVPYVRLALNVADAAELAGWLAGMPETIRVVE